MRSPLLVLLVWSLPALARAEFARPPDEVFVPEPRDPRAGEPWHPRTPDFSARLHVGPVFDLAEGDPGLHAALDIGRHNAGFRAASSFVAVGTDSGTAIYSGELWLCPIELDRLRPLVAAGAGYRDVSRAGPEGDTRHERAGVAVLRGGLEVLLPTRDVDTRASLSLAGHLPAIVSRSARDAKTTLLLTTSLAIGF